MTDQEKMTILRFRDEGLGARKISERTGISENTVKSYLRRNKKRACEHVCLFCGKPVEQTAGRKEKKFCSDSCRAKWWNRHININDRPGLKEYTCRCCGKKFRAYQGRKYCSHACYIKDRFGGGNEDACA